MNRLEGRKSDRESASGGKKVGRDNAGVGISKACANRPYFSKNAAGYNRNRAAVGGRLRAANSEFVGTDRAFSPPLVGPPYREHSNNPIRFKHVEVDHTPGRPLK